MKSLPPIALAFALAACNTTPETTDNAAINVTEATDLANFTVDDAPIIENADEAAAVTVPALPKPAVSTAETVLLDNAVEIETAIRAGRGIQRIRHGDGWAWMQGDNILRTADRDGRNIAYFRPGQTSPFFVQRGDRSFAYDGDKPVREFDRDGRVRTPDADEARKASDTARDQRRRADTARKEIEDPELRWGGNRPDERPTTTPKPTPSPSPTRGVRHPEWEQGRGDGKDEPRPKPERQ